MFEIKEATFGSDFEMGVVSLKTKKIIPVTGLLGGTKDNPKPMEGECYCQEDNVMAEFNIPPVDRVEDWMYQINDAKEKGNQILAKKKAKLTPISSHIYTDQELKDPTLRTLGCSPSSSAYSNTDVSPDGDSTNMRTCGFHIQLGFGRKDSENRNFTFETAQVLAKYFDLYLGIPSIHIDHDSERRKLYGKPGDFRHKAIWCDEIDGRINLFEYRSLGGNLLKNKKTIQWVFKQANIVIENFNNQTELPSDQILQETIMNNDGNTASKIMKKYSITLP